METQRIKEPFRLRGHRQSLKIVDYVAAVAACAHSWQKSVATRPGVMSRKCRRCRVVEHHYRRKP